MTLKTLGERIDTTAQTIQRLETSNMTVSIDWLERIAGVFGVEPAELLTDSVERTLSVLGRLGPNGVLHNPASPETARSISIDVRSNDPVVIELDSAVGDHPAGSFLIGDRRRGAECDNAIGHDALACLESGEILLCRVLRGRGRRYTLAPLRAGEAIEYDAMPRWIARLVMRVNYL